MDIVFFYLKLLDVQRNVDFVLFIILISVCIDYRRMYSYGILSLLIKVSRMGLKVDEISFEIAERKWIPYADRTSTGFSLKRELRPIEAWIRRLQKHYSCSIGWSNSDFGNCNCIWIRAGIPLVRFWLCENCIHKSFVKIFGGK